MKIRVSLAGRILPGASLPHELELPSGASLADAIASLRGQLPADQPLSPTWLVVVSGEHVGSIGRHTARSLKEGDELLLIAPVAGG